MFSKSSLEILNNRNNRSQFKGLDSWVSYIFKLIFANYLSTNYFPFSCQHACFFLHYFPMWLLVYLNANVYIFLFKLFFYIFRNNCTPQPD